MKDRIKVNIEKYKAREYSWCLTMFSQSLHEWALHKKEVRRNVGSMNLRKIHSSFVGWIQLF